MKPINIILATALLIIYPPLFVLAIAVDLFANLLQAAWQVPRYTFYRRPLPTSFWPRPFWTEPLQRRWYNCWQTNNQASYGVDIGWHSWLGPRTGRTSYAARPGPGSTFYPHGRGGADFATRPDPGPAFYSHGRGGKADPAARPGSGSTFYPQDRGGADSAARPGAGAGVFIGASAKSRQATHPSAGSLPNKGRSNIAQRPGSSFDPVVTRDGEGTAARPIQAHTLTQGRSQGVATRPERHDKNLADGLFGAGLQPVGRGNQTGMSDLRTHVGLGGPNTHLSGMKSGGYRH